MRRLSVLLAVALGVAALVTGPASFVQAAPGGLESVIINGTGNGHGRGLSQWGAYGWAVDYGANWTQILDHYYGGTVMGDVPASERISVRLLKLDGATSIGVVGHGAGGVTWNGQTYASLRAVLNAAGTFDVYANIGLVCNAGAAYLGTASTITFTTATGEDPASDSAASIGLCQPNGSIVHYRGSITVSNQPGLGTRAVNDVRVEDYLRGVVPKEVSASWGDAGGGAGMNALSAQAVAARSYALSQNRYSFARTCDSTSCQVYGGAATRSFPGGAVTSVEDRRTDTAIVATTGKVRLRPGSTAGPVSTEFSASNGPRTAGGTFPPVDDLGDATTRNPNHRWTRTLSADALAAQYGLGTLLSATMVDGDPRYDGIWYNDVVLTGSNGVVLRIGAWDFRNQQGLLSPGFTLQGSTQGGVPSNPGRLSPPNRIELQVAGAKVVGPDGTASTIPANVTAVSLNIAAVTPDNDGFVTVWPCSVARPLASNLNYQRGAIDGNGVIAPVDSSGKACLYSHVGTDLVVDIAGWFGPAVPGFTPITPYRLADSRDGTGISLGRVRPESPVALSVTGVSVKSVDGASVTVPASAVAAAINVTAVNPSAAGYVTIWPCGTTKPLVSTLNFTAGSIRANGAIAPLGAGGAVCVYVHAATDVVVDLVGWLEAGSSPSTAAFVSPTPQRWVDTRDGTGAPARAVTPSQPLQIAVTGRTMDVGGQLVTIPANAEAVAMNITVVDPSGAGFATVWPCGTARPTTASLNYPAGRITANNVIATVGAGGSICVYTHSEAHVVVDVNGWFAEGDTYNALIPGRIVDTRYGVGPQPT